MASTELKRNHRTSLDAPWTHEDYLDLIRSKVVGEAIALPNSAVCSCVRALSSKLKIANQCSELDSGVKNSRTWLTSAPNLNVTLLVANGESQPVCRKS